MAQNEPIDKKMMQHLDTIIPLELTAVEWTMVLAGLKTLVESLERFPSYPGGPVLDDTFVNALRIQLHKKTEERLKV